MMQKNAAGVFNAAAIVCVVRGLERDTGVVTDHCSRARSRCALLARSGAHRSNHGFPNEPTLKTRQTPR